MMTYWVDGDREGLTFDTRAEYERALDDHCTWWEFGDAARRPYHLPPALPGRHATPNDTRLAR